MSEHAFQKTLATVLIAVAVSLLSASASVAADPDSASLEQGRSAAEACEPSVMVCGIMGTDHVREFANRCAAQQAGAERVLVGPCFDAD